MDVAIVISVVPLMIFGALQSEFWQLGYFYFFSDVLPAILFAIFIAMLSAIKLPKMKIYKTKTEDLP